MKKWLSPANRQEAGVCFLLLCGAVSMGIVRPMLPLYLNFLELTPATVGIIVSVSMAGMIVGETLSGIISDRLGMRPPLLLGTIVCGLSLIAFVFSTAVPLLLLVGFIWGGLRVLIVGPVRGFMAAVAPPNRKATYIAFTGALLSLSRGVGALPGGLIADNLGYDWVFYIAAAVVIFGSLGLIDLPKTERLTKIEPTPNTTPAQSWKNWLPPFSLLIIVAILGFFNISVLLTYLPLLGTEVLGISATSVGLIFTVNGLATMLFSVPGGILIDRIGKIPAIVVGLVICALAMGGMALTPGYGWILGLGIIHALGMAIFITATIGILTEFVTRGKLATFIGIYGGIGENSGLMLGAAVGGFIWEGLGVSATFLSAVIACGIGILFCILLAKVLKYQKTEGVKV